jgi:hypothetical protein
MNPGENHAANTPTDGQFIRPCEGEATYKRLLPSLEDLRRPVSFFFDFRAGQ